MTDIQTTLALLEKLIAFDTVSRNPNIAIQDFIGHYLDDHDVQWLTIDYVPGEKRNLFATIGPAVDGGLVLSGHTDVVPVDNQPWTKNPFQLEIENDRVFGRGSVDMKGFIACCLALVPYFKSLNLAAPIHFAFSCDEEIGCHGVKPMVNEMSRTLPQPAACIIGEPTLGDVVNAQKGTVTYDTVITGVEAHSSNPKRGVNAISFAARIIEKLDKVAINLQHECYQDQSFEPPYSTLNVGTISGGTVKNIVPSLCTIRWECRPVPSVDYQSVLAEFFDFQDRLDQEIKALDGAASVQTKKINEVVGLSASQFNLAETLALQAANKNATKTVSFASEAGIFQRQGLDTVICGPGSIDQAHKPDEFIELSELEAYLSFLKKITLLWQGHHPEWPVVI
ncbi:MAG: acetylornithine deacetylase [Rhodobacteraceae bacterium]|nr:acetylornithine deacetylase [Paracoccaceae bacterium]